MMVMLGMISGPFQAKLFTVITLNQESSFTRREKNHFPIPLKYIDVTRTTDTLGCNVVVVENIDDCWNVDGDRELSDTWTSFTGDCWKCCLLYGDTQEEHAWNLIPRRSDDDDGASCVSNSTRTPHYSSSNCFTNSDVRSSAGNRQLCYSPSSERRSESHRREWPWSSEGILWQQNLDFQEWSKKTEAFFAGVIEESEMMLEWAAEQPTEITTTAIDLEFLPTDANEDRGVPNLEFVLQQMHTALMALTSCEPTTGGRKRNLLCTIISPGRCSLLELEAEIERWESHVSRNETKMKDKLDDEIKLAGLESLVPRSLRNV